MPFGLLTVILIWTPELAVLIDDVSAHRAPTDTELREWQGEQHVEKLKSIARNKDAKEEVAMSKSMTETALRKRREREEKRATAAAAAAMMALLDSAVDDGPPSAVQTFTNATMPENDEPQNSAGAAPGDEDASPFTVTIPTSSTNLAWYQASLHTYRTLAQAKDSGVWLFPSTPEEKARCCVFRALWDKGYYMGCGVKFGGEYLVYPGKSNCKTIICVRKINAGRV